MPESNPAQSSENDIPSMRSDQLVTRNFLTLGSGDAIARLISFSITIFIARELGAASFGVIGFASAILIYFTVLTEGGVEAAGPREIAFDKSRIETLVSSVLAFRSLVAILLAICLAAASNWLLLPPEATVLGTYALVLFGTAANLRWVYVGLEKTRFPAVVQILSEFLRLLFVVHFVHGPEDIVWVPISQVIAEFCFALAIMVGLRRFGLSVSIFQGRLSQALSLYKQALPLMGTTLCGLIIYNADVMFLRYFRTKDEIGYYLAAYSLIAFLGQFGNTVRMSLLPTLSRLENEQRWTLYHSAAARVFALGFPLAVGGYLVAPRMISIAFGQSYEGSEPLLRILICSVPLLLLRHVHQTVMIAQSQGGRVLRITAFTTLFTLGANWAVIPRYGAQGAAYTTVAAEMVRMLLSQYFLHLDRIRLPGFSRFWRVFVAGTLMGVVLTILWPSTLLMKITLGALCYACGLILTGGIRFQRSKFPVLNV